MPRIRPRVTNFTKGELTELVEGRVDLDQYFNGCKILENFYVLEQGPATRRPGTRFVNPVRSTTLTTRAVRFIASKTIAYMLEFSEGFIRFYRNGARVETSPGVPLEVVTPYVAADLKGLTFSQSNDVLFITSQFYSPRRLERYADLVWRLRLEPFTVPPSYEYGTRPTATLTPSATSGSGVTFTASVAQFQNSDIGREILVINGLNVSARVKITGFTSTTVVTGDISQPFANLVAIAASDWKMTDSYKTGLTPSVKSPVGVSVTLALDLAGWRTGDIGKFVQISGGLIEITGFSSPTSATGIIRSELAVVTKAESDAWTLEENAWSTQNGFPFCDEFFEERHYYANSLAQPQTFWGCKSGDFPNFGVGVLDDDGVQFTINDSQLNPIQWMRAARHLLMGTIASEFNTFGAQDHFITPTNIEARPETNNGSAAVQALRIGSVVLYVAGSARRIRELVFDYTIDSYVSPDLLVLAEHITRDTSIVEFAYKKEPTPFLLCVLANGTLAMCTYLREQNVVAWSRQVTGSVSINPDSGHASAVDGFVESVCVIPHPDLDRDQIWLIVRRTINGVVTRYVEYMDDSRFVYRQRHTDCCSIYDGTGITTMSLSATTGSVTVTVGSSTFTAADVGREIRLIGLGARALITAFTDATHVTATVINTFPSVGPFAAGAWGVARADLTGLGYLEGQQVDILSDGAPLSPKIVTGGVVTAGEKGIKIEVGLHFESVLETVRPEIQTPEGTIQYTQKHTPQVTLRVFESLGFEVNGKEEFVFRHAGDLANVPPELRTGDLSVKGITGYNREGRITIRQKQPLPLTVLMITGVMSIGSS